MEGPRSQGAMDIIKALRELHAEKTRLDAVIASLEAQVAAARKQGAARKSPGRRGRKSMSAAERLKVSKRMRLHWEARRAQLRELQDQAQQPSSTSAS
jgi:septal ring factor EnvC (AmiA/AmiB activator)